MNHLLDSFFVILAQINDTRVRFPKLVATGSIEEAASTAEDCTMDRPGAVVACDR